MESLMTVISFLGISGVCLVLAAAILFTYFLYALEAWVNYDPTDEDSHED